VCVCVRACACMHAGECFAFSRLLWNGCKRL